MIRTHFGSTLVLTALAAALQACADTGPPPASKVVDRYVEAIGGRAAAQRYPARHVVAEMTSPGPGTTISMEIWTARPNRMRARTVSDGMTITSGFDGTTAWAITPMTGAQILDRATFEQALGNANLDTNLDFAKSFPTMETIGERTVDGRACWNVRMVSAQGVELHDCFDKESGLLVGTVVPGKPARAGDPAADIVMSDYRDFDGLRMPTHMTTTVGGQRMVTTIKSVSHAPIADSIFALPPEVRALLH